MRQTTFVGNFIRFNFLHEVFFCMSDSFRDIIEQLKRGSFKPSSLTELDPHPRGLLTHINPSLSEAFKTILKTLGFFFHRLALFCLIWLGYKFFYVYWKVALIFSWTSSGEEEIEKSSRKFSKNKRADF